MSMASIAWICAAINPSLESSLQPGSLIYEGTVMKTNVGSIDRAIRIAAGVALIAGAFSGVIGVWGWLGVIPLATGIVGFCPAYLPFGFNTCSMKK